MRWRLVKWCWCERVTINRRDERERKMATKDDCRNEDVSSVIGCTRWTEGAVPRGPVYSVCWSSCRTRRRTTKEGKRQETSSARETTTRRWSRQKTQSLRLLAFRSTARDSPGLALSLSQKILCSALPPLSTFVPLSPSTSTLLQEPMAAQVIHPLPLSPLPLPRSSVAGLHPNTETKSRCPQSLLSATVFGANCFSS